MFYGSEIYGALELGTNMLYPLMHVLLISWQLYQRCLSTKLPHKLLTMLLVQVGRVEELALGRAVKVDLQAIAALVVTARDVVQNSILLLTSSTPVRA